MIRGVYTLIILFIGIVIKAQCPPPNFLYFDDLNCATTKANVTVQAIGLTPPLSYTWSPPVSTSSVGSNLNNGQYIITVKDANNCIMVGAYNLNLSALLNIDFTSSLNTKNVTCHGGTDGAISATVTGSYVNPPISYTWSTGSNSYSISNLASGIYTLTIQNSLGCVLTKTHNVTQPSEINSTINASVSCFGGTVNAPITTTGGIGSSYTYSVNGLAIAGNTVNNLPAGTHTITTKDANGCTKNNVVTVNQPAAPVFNFNITQPTCPTSSNGGLVVTVSNIVNPISSYTWNPQVSNTGTVINIPQGIYNVSIRDAANCVFSKTVQVVPISNLQATVITTPENCSAADGAATITATGGPLPLSYSLNSLPAQSSNVFSNLSTGTQSVVIRDANTCSLVTTFSIGNTSNVSLAVVSFTPVKCYNNCDGQILLNTTNAIAPVTYSFNGLPTFSTNFINTICAGTYTIRATDNIGCYATATVQFASPPSYTFNASGATQLCIGKTAVLNSSASGGTPPYSYVWMPGNLSGASVSVSPSSTTIYSLNVYDKNNCTLESKTVAIAVNAPITISVSPQNSGICPGTTAQITPSVTGGDGIYSYLWLPGNFTGPSIFISNLSTPSYTCIVNDACGSPTATQVINLQIFPVTTPQFSATQTSGCEPLCIKFVNTTPLTTNQVWNFGDRPFEQKVDNPDYCYFENGKYTVKLTITDANNCKFTTTAPNYIHVLEKPKPSFITKPEILTDDIGEGELVNTTLNGSSYQWFVDDEYISSSTNISVQCNDTVCYVIKLIAGNANGCIDSLLKKICVKPGFNFYMPNCFVPNGDGLNDILIPYGTSWVSENYSFRIYNRWGQLLFKTNDITVGWDGKEKGSVCPNDTYYYIIDVTDYYGKEHQYKGHITLLR